MEGYVVVLLSGVIIGVPLMLQLQLQPDTGGTLKIYGQSLCEDVPYKTLLLSVNDTAVYVVKEMLAKYGLTNQDPANYCLFQVCQ